MRPLSLYELSKTNPAYIRADTKDQLYLRRLRKRSVFRGLLLQGLFCKFTLERRAVLSSLRTRGEGRRGLFGMQGKEIVRRQSAFRLDARRNDRNHRFPLEERGKILALSLCGTVGRVLSFSFYGDGSFGVRSDDKRSGKTARIQSVAPSRGRTFGARRRTALRRRYKTTGNGRAKDFIPSRAGGKLARVLSRSKTEGVARKDRIDHRRYAYHRLYGIRTFLYAQTCRRKRSKRIDVNERTAQADREKSTETGRTGAYASRRNPDGAINKINRLASSARKSGVGVQAMRLWTTKREISRKFRPAYASRRTPDGAINKINRLASSARRANARRALILFRCFRYKRAE